MLLTQDISVVIGREEIPFEDDYRSSLAPRVADDAGSRFAGFFWAPHGTGEGYEAVTLTALEDIEAFGRHDSRLADGDLADVWRELTAKQRRSESTLQVVADWCELARGGLDAFEVEEGPAAMFRLDSFRVSGSVAEGVAAIETQVATASEDDPVSVVGCWSPFLGDLSDPVVTVLSRVRSDDALREVLARPTEPWPGVPDLPGGRRACRVLRSVAWSPVLGTARG